MNKKSGIVFGTVIVLGCTTLAANLPATGKLDTPAKRAAYARQRKIEAMTKLGGLIDAPVKGNVVRFVNLQKTLESQFIKDVANDLAKTTTIGIEVVDAEPIDGNTGASVRLVDSPNAPTLLVAPENFWCEFNVAAISADNPDKNRLLRRARQEINRAFYMALGAGNSVHQPCLMHSIGSLKELDATMTLTPCPEALDKIQRTADERKLGRHRLVTYRKACEEGWAPAPTNAIQKAIWDKVHEMPAEPLKIKPETKKVVE